MKGNTSAIHSKYIIDGIMYNVSPAEMLEAAKGQKTSSSQEEFEPIVDENIDSKPLSGDFSNSETNKYLNLILETNPKKINFPIQYAESHTKWLVAKALIDSLWLNGKFRLEDLAIEVEWKWNCEPIGNMGAFYKSVSALTDYIDMLNIQLKSYSFEESDSCSINIKTILSPNANKFEEGEEYKIQSELYEFESPLKPRVIKMSNRRKCPKTITNNPDNWLLFIPFDTCDFKLGGSTLSILSNKPSFIGPNIGDADYFIDCFEVVREMVEDGIIQAAHTIEEGGLITSLKKFLGEGVGMNLDISGIIQSYGENDIIPILFSEIPGVIIEINGNDYDYIDAEFLLQDVAYYPLGQVSKTRKTIGVQASDSSGIANIMQSLLSSQASEGED